MTNEKKNIVVSLTSYPKRIHKVSQVIESIWNQSIQPNEILLYLSILEFPKREKDIPLKLWNMVGEKNFNIVWVDDNLKSHKKYYYVLQEKRDSIVITIDDDIIYADTLLSDLLTSYEKFPYAISARRARIILKDKERIANYIEWNGGLEEYVDQPRKDLCAIGVGGILYPPGCASNEWFSKEKIRELAENQDDLWLKFNELKEGIPVVYIKPKEQDLDINEASEKSLSSLNMQGGENDISINKLIIDLKGYNIKIYNELIQDILSIDEYYLIKRKYSIEKTIKKIPNNENVPIYLYGAGKIAKAMLSFFMDCNLDDRIKAVVVSDINKNPKSLYGKKVLQINEIDSNTECCMICGVGNRYKKEIVNMLHNTNIELIDLEIRGIVQHYL